MSRLMLKSTAYENFSRSLMIKSTTKRKSLSPFTINKVKNQEDKWNHIRQGPLHINNSNYVSQAGMSGTKRRLSLTNTCKKHSLVSDVHILNKKYQKVKQMLGDERYQEAIPHLRQLIYSVEGGSRQRELYFWLAISFGKLNRMFQAEQLLRECLEIYPTYYDAYLYLGKIYTRLKKYSHALTTLKKAISLDQTNSSAYIEMGQCYIHSGNPKQADLVWKLGYQHVPNSVTLPTRIIENMLQKGYTEQCYQYISKLSANCSNQSSDLLYLRGLIQKAQGRNGQACIYFEECLKYNNRKNSVTKSVYQLIDIYIKQRDYYAAYHIVSRAKFLGIEMSKIECHVTFLQGVILLIKKKYQEGLNILLNGFTNKNNTQEQLKWLVHKYLAYGYFKLGRHQETINQYHQLPPQEVDRVSQYNLLLAQGIISVDSNFDYQQGLNKFQKAKLVYPQKVQPYIYIAVTIIFQALYSQYDKETAVLAALTELQLGIQTNPNSSNLLYHRTILHFYLQNWQQAHQDINKCIEKAQQNLPKYFYIRGLCYACEKNMKKAINEYSISISLSSEFIMAYLERSKCYFLSGDTQNGFKDLKIYMEMNPQDYSIHKWIGDLLYEGGSDADAIKAYDEMKQKICFQALLMKAKAHLRVSSFQIFKETIKIIEKHPQCEQKKIRVDVTCMNLLQTLGKQDAVNRKDTCKQKQQLLKELGCQLKSLNSRLEQNHVGYIFQLLDCMNLLGVTSFYLSHYDEAYESFLLVEDLFLSLNKGIQMQKPTNQKDLQLQHIYMNLFLCQLAKGQPQVALHILTHQLSNNCHQQYLKSINKIRKSLENQQNNTLTIHTQDTIFGKKMKKVELTLQSITIKSAMNFHPYRESVPYLYSIPIARKMIEQLHAGYIDDMPQGPWIKRNEYGVVFTQDILNNDSFTFETTIRLSERQQEQDNLENELTKREEFLKKVKMDPTIEQRINNLIGRSY